MNVVDALVSVGILNALLIAAAAGVGRRRDPRWGWLCALFSLLFLTISAIAISHRSEGKVERIAVAVEQLGWAAGPLLYLFVRVAIGNRVSTSNAAPHLVVPAAVVLVGAPVILLAGYEPLPPELLILFQIAYTIAAFGQFLRRPEPDDRSSFGFWWPAVALTMMTGIHGAQLARLSPWRTEFTDAVPIIASIAVIVTLFLVLVIIPPPKPRSARYAKSAIDPAQAQTTFAAARAVMSEPAMFGRPDLCLSDVAARLDIRPHHLSQALSVGGDTSFAELLGDIRVEEAKRLLLDPRNAGVAVEPLGMEAGFRSRSAFYACFRSRTGLAPADYRRNGGKIVSGPTGEDKAGRDRDRSRS